MDEYSKIENAEDFVVYLASGWFNDQQMECMTRLYNFLLDCSFTVHSPYYSGIVVNKDNDSPEIREKAYSWNLDHIDIADIVVAVIDDYDAGTMFEIGYAVRVSEEDTLNDNPYIITYSDVSGRGLNLMLQQSSDAFANGMDELYEQLKRYVNAEPPLDTLPYKKGDVI